MLVSGTDAQGPFLRYYRKKDEQIWLAEFDTLALEITQLSARDWDGDVLPDIFATGIDNAGDHYDLLLFNRPDTTGTLQWKIDTLSINGGNSYQVADFNNNGSPELLQMNAGGARLIEFPSRGVRQVRDTLIDLSKNAEFVADLNSDGRVDLSVRQAGNRAIMYSDGTDVLLQRGNVPLQSFGDWDRDGDLDLIQGSTDSLYLLRNDAVAENQSPQRPQSALGLSVFDKLFIYWEPGTDDHTPVAAITYDLTIQTNAGNVITGEFDLFTNRRLTVSAGNVGSRNYALLNLRQTDTYTYFVQSVDNSFHAGATLSGNCLPCSSAIEMQDIASCGAGNIVLEETQEVLWFSFQQGFLGISDRMTFDGFKQDTVFSFNPQTNHCGSVKLYQLKHEEVLVQEESDSLTVCQGAVVELGVEPGWAEVSWSGPSGFTSDQDTIEWTAVTEGTVTARLTDGEGCVITRDFVIKANEVKLEPADASYQILRGGEVEIEISGAVSYSWQPSTGLSNPSISNPVASPVQTTQYFVTGTDSIGCTGMAKVLIVVEFTAYVPTLFTPNNDGKNDALKVYGLTDANDFDLVIYNREGAQVFTTNSVSEASNLGWDGTTRGVLQPAGVYTWKVRGKQNNGRPVLLNGKQSGSVVLVR